MTRDEHIAKRTEFALANHPPLQSRFEALGLLTHKVESFSRHLSGSGNRDRPERLNEQIETLIQIGIVARRALDDLYANVRPEETISYFRQ